MPNTTPLGKLIKSVKNNIDSNHMESKVCFGIYFSSEIIDIDGITGAIIFRMHGLLDG